MQPRRHRALLAYLLLLTVTQPLDKRPKPLAAKVWARAVPRPAGPRVAGDVEDTGLDDARAAAAQAHREERQACLVKVTLRKANGRGPHTRPRPDQPAAPPHRDLLPDISSDVFSTAARLAA